MLFRHKYTYLYKIIISYIINNAVVLRCLPHKNVGKTCLRGYRCCFMEVNTMAKMLSWDLVTTQKVKQTAYFAGAVNSKSGPKLFYIMNLENGDYIVTIDESRDEIVSIINKDSGEVESLHPLAQEGEKMKNRIEEGLNISFGSRGNE